MIGNILHAFAEYKFLTAVLVFAAVLAVFVWIKAIRASKRHNAEREAVLAKLQKEKELRERFACLTPELVQSADVCDLLHGVALGIQSQIEKAEDVNASFLALSEAQQYVYALNFVFCEDADTLSRFFRLNGKPLTTAALDAARRTFDADTLALFEMGYRMFDADDETTSSLPDDVDALDRSFSSADKTVLFDNIRKYIAEQIENI